MTGHPFTVAICTSCAAEPPERLLPMLRASIRSCPHGMLVTTGCLLGRLTCATRPSQQGVLLLLQPCSTQRIPTGPAQWMGPVNDTEDARALCDWFGARQLATLHVAGSSACRSELRQTQHAKLTPHHCTSLVRAVNR
jgi:hypothetical protein